MEILYVSPFSPSLSPLTLGFGGSCGSKEWDLSLGLEEELLIKMLYRGFVCYFD